MKSIVPMKSLFSLPSAGLVNRTKSGAVAPLTELVLSNFNNALEVGDLICNGEAGEVVPIPNLPADSSK